MIIPIELRFKADKDSKSAFRTDKTIKSHDVNSVEFHISIEGLGLTDNHTAKILSIFHSSKSQANVECEIVAGKIIYKPDTNLISRHEHVTNYVYVYNGNQSLDVREFIYSVSLSKIDETALKVKEVYDQSYSDLLADFEQALEDYKLTLPQADSVRADIDAILNQFSEDSQKVIGDLVEVSATAEIAEASRVQAESERVQAETERKEAEILREANYEQLIDTALTEADVVGKVDNKVTELTPQINDLTAQLAQKATRKELESVASGTPKGVFESLSDLESEHPNGTDGIFVIENTGGWYFWDGSGWQLGGTYQTPMTTFFSTRNELIDGNFSNGLDSWGHLDTVVSLTETNSGALMTALVNSVTRGGIFSQANIVSNHKYYIRLSLKANRDMRIDVASGNAIVAVKEVGRVKAGVNSVISGVHEFDTNESRLVFGTRSIKAGDEIEFSQIVVIDLTKTFGEGLEPTVERVDYILEKYHEGYISNDYTSFLSEQEFHNLIDFDYKRDEHIKNSMQQFDKRMSRTYSFDGNLYRDKDWIYDEPLDSEGSISFEHFWNDKLGLRVSPEHGSTRLLVEESVSTFGAGVFFRMVDIENYQLNEHTILYGHTDDNNRFRIFYSRTYDRFQFDYTSNGIDHKGFIPTSTLDQKIQGDEPIGVYLTVDTKRGILLHLWKDNETHIRIFFRDIEPFGYLNHISIGHRVRAFTQIGSFTNGIYSNFRFDDGITNKPDGLSFIEGVIK